MALIPAGEFEMGSDKGLSGERPAHKVILRDFYIDLFEVTNDKYRACVSAGKCQIPKNTRSLKRATYYGNPSFGNYPVVYVTWQMAQDFCAWRAARLPTEAEWEKAARGPLTDSRLAPTYPWGEGAFCTIANYCQDDTTETGRYENGRSYYGLYDMAANVAEWVADWYDENAYQSAPTENPTGPPSGSLKVVRGGSFNDHSYTDIQSFHRTAYAPEDATYFIGFRCVKDIP